MERSPSLRRSLLIWSRKSSQRTEFHWRVHNSLPVASVLCPAQTVIQITKLWHFNIIHPSIPNSKSCFYPSNLTTKVSRLCSPFQYYPSIIFMVFQVPQFSSFHNKNSLRIIISFFQWHFINFRELYFRSHSSHPSPDSSHVNLSLLFLLLNIASFWQRRWPKLLTSTAVHVLSTYPHYTKTLFIKLWFANLRCSATVSGKKLQKLYQILN